MKISRADIALRHAEYYFGILDSANETYKTGAEGVRVGLMAYDNESGNIMSAQAWSASKAGQVEAATKLTCQFPDIGFYILMLRIPAKTGVIWLEQAIAASNRLNDLEAEGDHWDNLGILNLRLGKPLNALECHDRALCISRMRGDRRREGEALGNLGATRVEQGNIPVAMPYLEEALRISGEIDDRRGRARYMRNLANAHRLLADFARAKHLCEKAIALSQEIGDLSSEGFALNYLGLVCVDIGDLANAIQLYGKALLVSREIGDRRLEGITLLNFSQAFHKTEKNGRAHKYQKQALDIFSSLGEQ